MLLILLEIPVFSFLPSQFIPLHLPPILLETHNDTCAKVQRVSRIFLAWRGSWRSKWSNWPLVQGALLAQQALAAFTFSSWTAAGALSTMIAIDTCRRCLRHRQKLSRTPVLFKPSSIPLEMIYTWRKCRQHLPVSIVIDACFVSQQEGKKERKSI